jgi:predicted Fe-Mo cluster-binding NifX family protein
MTKIAVPSDDGLTIANHFGKCALFIVFNVQNEQVTGAETRPNTTACNHGEHADTGHCGHGHTGGHGGFVTLLHDCTVVLCRGMGMGAEQALAQNGILPVAAGEFPTAREAVDAYLNGGRTDVAVPACGCHG